MHKIEMIYACPEGELHMASALLVFGYPLFKRDRVLVSRANLEKVFDQLFKKDEPKNG